MREKTDRKRLLILSIFPAPYRVAVFRELARHYDVELFFEVVQNQDRNAKWFVESDEFKVLNTEENLAAYRRCLKRLKSYDMVLAYDYFSRRAGQLIFRCMAAGVPYAINCDGAFINRNPLKTAVKRLFVTHAALCFASGGSAGKYFRYYGAREEQIRYHYFTSLTEADYLEQPLTQEEKKGLRRELGLAEGKTVLSVGQFIHRKGYDVLLRAWKEVDEDANLVIIGGGGLRQSYLELIRELGLAHVTLLDFMDKERLIQMYRQADLFVLPTREDVWGLVINEAMANGLPVISTDRCIAGLELVEKGKNGYIVPAENTRLLAQAMKRILSSPRRMEAMGRNSLERVKGHTMEEIGKGHIRDIDQYLAGRKERINRRRGNQQR